MELHRQNAMHNYAIIGGLFRGSLEHCTEKTGAAHLLDRSAESHGLNDLFLGHGRSIGKPLGSRTGYIVGSCQAFFQVRV